MYLSRLRQIHCPEPAGYQKIRPGNQHFKSNIRFQQPGDRNCLNHQWQRMYNLSTRFQYTASYTSLIPSEKSDMVLSVTQVMLANQRTGRRKSYQSKPYFIAVVEDKVTPKSSSQQLQALWPAASFSGFQVLATGTPVFKLEKIQKHV